MPDIYNNFTAFEITLKLFASHVNTTLEETFKSAYKQVGHRAWANPGFHRMKRLRVFLHVLPPDGMSVHCRVTSSIRFVGTNLYNSVERGTVRVICLAQEHNTMSLVRARIRTAQFRRDERSNHGITVTLTRSMQGKFSHKIKIYTQDLTSKEEENQHHNKRVAEVQKGWGCSSDCQLRDKEMNRVQEEINCSTAASQEWTPPPVIILQINKSLRLSRNEFYWSKKEEFVRKCTYW